MFHRPRQAAGHSCRVCLEDFRVLWEPQTLNGWKRKPPPGPFARARAGAGGAGESRRACAVAARRCRRGPRRVTPGQRSRVTSAARRDWLRARGAVAKLEPRDGAGRLGSLAAATCAGGVSASPRRGPRCSSWTPGGAKPAPESARAFPVAYLYSSVSKMDLMKGVIFLTDGDYFAVVLSILGDFTGMKQHTGV